MAASKHSEETTPQVHDLDSLLTLLKPSLGFGKFQIFNMACIASIVVLCTFSELGYILTTAEVKHRCLISECEDGNATYSDADKPWLPYAINSTADSGKYDYCTRYKYNSSASSPQLKCSNQSFTPESYRCDEFVYETTEWTIGREDWGIHCNNDRYLLSLVGSLNNAGQVIGGLYAGYLQDRYGRKLVIVTLAIIVIIIGSIKSFSVNYAMMLAMETLEATAAVALFNGPFVLALEIVEPSSRVLAGTIVSLAYPTGEMILGLVQYLTLDWRNTIRICYLPFLTVISFYWILPESVRWLLDNGRTDETIKILRKMAQMNETKFPEEAIHDITQAEITRSQKAKTEEKSFSTVARLKELWRSKIMRRRVIFTYLLWICVIFVYFAMVMNSVGISDNKFVDFALNGVVEIPSYFFVYFVLDRLGRKTTQASLLSLCCVACIVDAYIPQDDDLTWLRLLLYLIGKFGASGALFVVDVYTTEMFPTFVRSTIMSTGLLVGKLATIIAPEISLLEDIYKPLPLLIFAGMSFIGVLATLTFPETLDCNLPDTIEEAESIGRKPREEKLTEAS